MKTEILRFNNVSAVFSEAERLDNINFSIYEKELIGLIGLKGAGVMRIVNLLIGQGTVSSGSISFQQKSYSPRDVLDANRNKIFVVKRSTSLLLDFSIAENLFLIRGSIRSFSIYSEKLANREAGRVLKEFGVDLSPETLCSELTRFEKMIVELVKIYIQRPRVIILYDFLTDFSQDMSFLLQNAFRILAARDVSIIVAINDYTEIISDFDRLYIVSDGQIGKTLYKAEFGKEAISAFLLTGQRKKSRIIQDMQIFHQPFSGWRTFIAERFTTFRWRFRSVRFLVYLMRITPAARSFQNCLLVTEKYCPVSFISTRRS